MATLNALPNELLSLITSHLEHPRDLLRLSLTDRRLSEFAKLDGWKAFLKGRFGLVGLDSDAQNTVHGLTTLYRNWDRKGFIARYLEPFEKTINLSTWQSQRWRGPQGQTMGYQPSLDSYEEILGAWDERREVLAWSAGTQIIMRIKETGSGIERIRKAESGTNQDPNQTWVYDSFRHLNSWYTYRIPNSFEGRDDITSLKLLRPHQRDMAYEDLVFGTASGQLSLLSVSPDQNETWEKQFHTGRQAVGALSISSCRSPMLAASLGDQAVSLYPIDRDSFSDTEVDEVSRVTPTLPGLRNGRIWSCNFISDDQVAIGLGPSAGPIHVYKITPEGFLSEPLRTIKLETKTSRLTSVYPILPIPNTAQGGFGSGNTFLSGGYDGIIRLHDMRSPRDVETVFWDPTNDSSIYSLAAQGLERVVAGVSMHSMIKVFDLRFSGSHAYHTISMPSRPRKKKAKGQDVAINTIVNGTRDNVSVVSGGWNLYLNPRQPPKRNAYRGDYWRGREDSPVYSLSIPSQTSQNLYAGLEGTVQSLTFHGVADAHPDTMLSQSISRFSDSGAVDIRSSYDPRGDALNLGMYEQGTEEGLGMQLLVQGDVATSTVDNDKSKHIAALDERWKDLRHEGDRWARGDVPSGPTRPRGRGRGPRGRSRGRP